MYNICQSFNFFDVIEEYYASTVRQPRKNSMHFMKFSVCSCWKERFFCMCQWTIDIIKNNWKWKLWTIIVHWNTVEFNKDVTLSIIEMFALFQRLPLYLKTRLPVLLNSTRIYRFCLKILLLIILTIDVYRLTRI